MPRTGFPTQQPLGDEAQKTKGVVAWGQQLRYLLKARSNCPTRFMQNHLYAIRNWISQISMKNPVPVKRQEHRTEHVIANTSAQ